MSSLLCLCALIHFVLMMTSLSTTYAAPARTNRRSVNVDAGSEDTVLSLVMRSADDESISNFDQGDVDQADDVVRRKRSAQTDSSRGSSRHHLVDDVPLAISDDDLRELMPAERRHRRSAAWWMAAMVALCDKHQVCRQVQITEGDLTMVVKMLDE